MQGKYVSRFQSLVLISLLSIFGYLLAIPSDATADDPVVPFLDLISPKKTMPIEELRTFSHETFSRDVTFRMELEVINVTRGNASRIYHGDVLRLIVKITNEGANTEAGAFAGFLGFPGGDPSSYVGTCGNYCLTPGAPQVMIGTENFTFDFYEHTRLIDGRPTFIATSEVSSGTRYTDHAILGDCQNSGETVLLYPLDVGGTDSDPGTSAFTQGGDDNGGGDGEDDDGVDPIDPVDLGDSLFTMLAKYQCTNDVNCPPMPVCSDCCITAGHSQLSPPSELAGKHRTTDFLANPGQSGCSACSGGANESPGSKLPSLDITRLFMPSNLDARSNLPPGMFFSFDYELSYYPGAEEENGCMILFDPGTGRQMHFENSNQVADTYMHKMMVGSEVVETQSVFSNISYSGGPTVTATRRDGKIYTFEMVEVDSVLTGRIKTISYPSGHSISFDYLYEPNDPAQEDNQAARLQLDKITDAHGMVAQFYYSDDEGEQATMIASRYVVEKIEIKSSAAGSVLSTLDYTYVDDKLSTVTRSNGGAPTTISQYVYGTGEDNDTIKLIETEGSVPDIKTLFLSNNYQDTGAGLALTAHSVLQGVSDGNGDVYLSIWQVDPTSGRFSINYRGRNMEWSPGQYLYYLDDEGNPESTFAQHPSTADGTTNEQAREIILRQPATIETESGMQVSLAYDERGNLTSKEYLVDGSTEVWQYDEVYNQQTFYKDREGSVMLSFLDDKGRVIRAVQGLVDGDGGSGPTVDGDTIPVEMQYGYYPDNASGDGEQAGLLHWSGQVAYGGDIDHNNDSATVYKYNAEGRLEFVEKPTPPLGTTTTTEPQDSVVQYFYNDLGQLWKMHNELDHETEYAYDAVDRNVWTEYHDGTVESVRYEHEANGSATVYRKNRKEVVSLSEYDAAGRMIRQIPAYALATASDWHLAEDHTSVISSLSDSPSLQQQSEYMFMPGYAQPFIMSRNGSITHYSHDYRGRVIREMMLTSSENATHTHTNYVKNRVASVEKRLGIPQGDLDLDGHLTLLDIGLFQSLLSGNTNGLPEGLAVLIGDLNGDGVVSLLDVGAFRDAITGGGDSSTLYSKSYNVYSANEFHVRVITPIDPNIDLSNFDDADLLGWSRSGNNSGVNSADLVIQDAVRNRRGDIVRTVNGLGAIQQTVVDGMGRTVQQSTIEGALAADGTLGQSISETLISQTSYNPYGNVGFTINPSGLKTSYSYLPIATDIVGSMTISTAGNQYPSSALPVALTTRYEYDAAGRQVAVIAPGPNGSPADNRTSNVEYGECCGLFTANIDALGHARTSRRNSIGESIHSSVMRDYSSYQDALDTDGPVPSNLSRIRTSHVLSESTSRYRPDGRMEFQTRWKTVLSSTLGNQMPIAGIESKPAIDGVTTRYLYDFDLSDASGAGGLSSETGESFSRLWDSSEAVVSLQEALAQLAKPIAEAGAGISFSASAPGSATAVVGPDEKTVQFTISDASGRTVMSGLLAGPAAPLTNVSPDEQEIQPNSLLDWTCTLYDQVDTATGKVETLVIRPDRIDDEIVGVTSRSIANAVGWNESSFDEQDYQTTFLYDQGGNVTATDQLDESGGVAQGMSYTYDFMGRRVSTTDQTLGRPTPSNYDSAGRVWQQEDAKGNGSFGSHTTVQEYDVLDRPTILTDRLGHQTVRAYNTATGNDFVNTVTDAEDNTTTYTLDLLGRRKYVDLENGQRMEFVYDAAGRQKEIKYYAESNQETPPIARRLYYYQEPSGVLDKIVYYDAGDSIIATDQFEYNDVLQRTEAKQFAGPTTVTPEHQLEFQYTLRNQIFRELTTVDGETYEVSNHYDNRGRLSKIVYPSGRAVDYTHTPRSEVDKISWSGTEIEDRDYTSLGQLHKINRAGAAGPVVETRNWNGRRLTSIDLIPLGLGTVAYAYDANHNKVSESFDDSRLVDFSFNTTPATANTDGYDAEDRFIQFNRPGQGESDVRFERWANTSSDSSIGNIHNISGGDYAGNRQFNSIHQLQGNSRDYDDAGNLTSTGTGIDLTWNIAAGRLESATDGDSSYLYRYDATGRRARKDLDDNDVVYIYHGPNVIAEYLSGSTIPSNEYVYADGIDSLAMIAHNNNTDRLGVIRNQQWSVIALVNNDSGSVSELYSYNVFGERTVIDSAGNAVVASGNENPSAYDNPYGYTSRRHDDETGLMYFRARYYDPATGEFTSQDPLEYVNGMSLYRGYFSINKIDPLGLACKDNGQQCQYVSGRGVFSHLQHRPTDRVKRLESDFTAFWDPFENKFIDSKGCKCCKQIGTLQIVKEVVRNENPTFLGGNSPSPSLFCEFLPSLHEIFLTFDWKQDGPFPYQFGNDTIDPTSFHVLNHPDTPGLDAYSFGIGSVQYYAVDFEFCVVCLEGIERNSVYGCLQWGHEFRRKRCGNRTVADYSVLRYITGIGAFDKFFDKNANIAGRKPSSTMKEFLRKAKK